MFESWKFMFTIDPLPHGDYITPQWNESYFLMHGINNAVKAELGKPLEFHGTRQIRLAPFTLQYKLVKYQVLTGDRTYYDEALGLMEMLRSIGGYTNGVEGHNTEGKYQFDLYLLDAGEKFQLARIERRIGEKERRK